MKVLPKCTHCNFGLQIELDPLLAVLMYLIFMLNQVQPDCFCLSKLLKERFISHIFEFFCHRIFSKSEATTALGRIRDEEVSEFHITFAIEPALTMK